MLSHYFTEVLSCLLLQDEGSLAHSVDLVAWNGIAGAFRWNLGLVLYEFGTGHRKNVADEEEADYCDQARYGICWPVNVLTLAKDAEHVVKAVSIDLFIAWDGGCDWWLDIQAK